MRWRTYKRLGNRCERVAGGIDDNRISFLARQLNEIDERSFVVRLVK
jgi:hypothetical protein